MNGVGVMAKIIAMCFALLLAAGLGGCLTATTSQYPEKITTSSRIDGEYGPVLAQHYETMAALYRINGMRELADLFAGRTALAITGIWVEPMRPNASAEKEHAFTMLMTALTDAMNGENALWLARAQVNYDCWNISDDDSCKKDFDKAMRAITIPIQSLQTKAVYFDADSSALSDDTRTQLMNIANMLRMNKMLDVRLTGSTDHPDTNKSLALRRAIAVRNLLTQMGVAASRITVKDENNGDVILSQQTPEDGEDIKARRVDIVLEPVFGQVI
jgi:outer membrane protein OmpA-like peptidoglycan-associated protein